ncbi:MAG: hypothetical protein JNL97_13510, partial [Verrucomicrobiales bacterium]|nr:hypothetical protein [Verrucomicrobiales bacterium]
MIPKRHLNRLIRANLHFGLLAAPLTLLAAETADVLYRGGSILTMAGKEPTYV